MKDAMKKNRSEVKETMNREKQSQVRRLMVKKIIIQKEIKEEDLDELKSIGRVKRIYWEGNKGGS